MASKSAEHLEFVPLDVDLAEVRSPVGLDKGIECCHPHGLPAIPVELLESAAGTHGVRPLAGEARERATARNEEIGLAVFGSERGLDEL